MVRLRALIVVKVWETLKVSGLGRYLYSSLGAHPLDWGMDEWYGLVRLRVLIVSGIDLAS